MLGDIPEWQSQPPSNRGGRFSAGSSTNPYKFLRRFLKLSKL
jgi:hypothetical protein